MDNSVSCVPFFKGYAIIIRDVRDILLHRVSTRREVLCPRAHFYCFCFCFCFFFTFFFVANPLHWPDSRIENTIECSPPHHIPPPKSEFVWFYQKKKIVSSPGLKILHEKSRIFEMRRILFLQKNPPKKKKNFPPQRAVVARFARASLAATERRGGSICEIIKNGNLFLSLAPYAPRTVQNQYVFQKQGLMQRRVIFKERQKFCSFGAKCKGIQRHCQLYFFAEQKN